MNNLDLYPIINKIEKISVEQYKWLVDNVFAKS